MTQLNGFFVVVLFCLGVTGCTSNILQPTQEQPLAQPNAAQRDRPQSHAIASAHPLATQAGLEVLAEGGNAFDAAVTVAAVLAVVEPFGSGLGGGGFWLLHDHARARSSFIDGRERAPGSATPGMYQSKDGVVDQEGSVNGPLAAAIPGTPAALVHVQKTRGSKSLARLLRPAIKHARQGFAVTSEYRDALQMRLTALQKWPSAALFLQDGQLPNPGWILQQPDLANTLERLAQLGHDGFYTGQTAKTMVESVRQHGGVWTLQDLQNYQVVERQPISFTFNNALITSAPLPSSGGLVMGLIFGQLQQLDYMAADEQTRRHLFIEAMRQAYHQRALTMGDADFTKDEGVWLLEQKKYKQLAARIKPSKAGISDQLPAVTSGTKGNQTTHFSIIDAKGNRAAVTLSLNLYFGSGFVAKGSGVLLNNEMDDFSAKPGVPNKYGLVGSVANQIEPGKRPLSSMSPTFIETDQDVYILGTPGGSRIISMVAGAGLHILTQPQAKAQEVVDAGRIHHQYLPDTVFFEPQVLTAKEQTLLQQKGHTIKAASRQYGDMQLIRWNKALGTLEAAADSRGEGVATVQSQAK